jgi:hypothetical protein
MVTVNNYVLRLRKDGSEFVVLELVGGLELIKSNTTEKFYATMRKCSVPSTFDEATAKLFIGSQLPGQIVKLECPAYEFVNKRTGELMMLNYTFGYQASVNEVAVGNTRVTDLELA